MAVEDDEDELALGVALGRSDAQAESAAFTVGFEVSVMLGDFVPLAPVVALVDRVGTDTPCNCKQFV